MEFTELFEVNKQIMELIRSKYPYSHPSDFSSSDRRYYEHLQEEVEKAERYIEGTEKKEKLC